MNIQTQDNCKQLFDEMKFQKNTRYIIYTISKEKIVVEKIGGKEQTWDTFLNALPSNQYRYAVFDFEFVNADKMNISKMVFVNWCPTDAAIKGKMIYATAKQSFKKYLDILHKDFTLDSKGDMTQKDMIKQLSK